MITAVVLGTVATVIALLGLFGRESKGNPRPAQIVVFALPLAWIWMRGQLTPYLKPRLLALLVLGGLPGALGWAMVA
ncbi:MAG: hypothetical protein WCI74_17965, partial [Actinomycetes bacterium]